MIGNSITSARPASLSEVQKILEERQKAGDFGFEQQTSLDYSKKFTKEHADSIIAALEKNGKVKHETAVKIADIMPKSRATLAVIFAKDKADLSESEIKEILEKMKKS